MALPAGQGAAAFADDGVVTLGQFQDEVVSAGERCRLDDALHRHGWIGQRDVLANRAVEQHVLLQDDADLASQPGQIDHREIDAVDQHASALRHIETLDQLGDGALARARRADDADDLARLDAE